MVEDLTHCCFQDYLGEISSTVTTPTSGPPATVFPPHSPTNPPPAQSSHSPTASDGGGCWPSTHHHDPMWQDHFNSLRQPFTYNVKSAAEIDELVRIQMEQNLSQPPLNEKLTGIIQSIKTISPALSEQMILERSINPAVLRFNAPQPVTSRHEQSERAKTPVTPPATYDEMGGLQWHQSDEQLLSQSDNGIASDHSSMDGQSSEETSGDELTGSDWEIANQSIIVGHQVDPDHTSASFLSNPAQSIHGTLESRWVGRYLMYSLLSNNRLAYLKEQSPANSINFFNLKGTLMSFKEGITLGKREGICDNIILAVGKLVTECKNNKVPGIVNRVVVVDPRYTRRLTMESLKGDTKNSALVNMMAKHKTPSTRQYFFPTNAEKTHWFLIVADIINGKITGMETLQKDRTGALIKVRNILNDNWSVLGNGPKPVWKPKMTMPPAMPLQKDSVQSGIFTCAFMDLIAAGVTYSSLKSLVCNSNIEYIRRRFAWFMDGFNHA
jgi:hypothetical protein